MTDRKNQFDTFVKTKLNTEQKKAVTHGNGSILVIAGAGSGKTRVITARITYLILNKKVKPSAIIALTFTNKAAHEMKERIAHFLGFNHELPFIGTFHSYCLKLLKQNRDRLNLPSFSIIDEDDKRKIINGILQRTNLHKQITARSAAYQISQIKNKQIEPNKVTNAHFTHPFMHDIYEAYEAEKKVSKCFDFDDLLLEALALFKTKRTFKQHHQEQVKHILVDEYQDTNVVQHELLKQMALKGTTQPSLIRARHARQASAGSPTIHPDSHLSDIPTSEKKVILHSICAVGDEDQSIYSWRGATVANILHFQKDFPKTGIIKIEQNYRSVQPILDVANNVIKHNKNRKPKKLWSEKKGKDRVRVLTCVSEYQEGDAIAQFVNIASQKQKRSSIAVLYRTHAQSRALEEALIKNSIPYKIIGGVQFYERKEIKDLLAYLRLIANPFDRPSLFRIINTPARGLGKKFEQDFYDVWHAEPFLTFTQAAQKVIDNGIVKGNKKAALESFMNIFHAINPTQLPSKALEHIIEKTGYVAYLKDAYEPEEAQTRVENIKELIDAARYFEAQQINTIELLLDEVALMQDKKNSNDEQQDKVLLMTLHAAKGLEFDTVILAGLEEGIMPTTRALQDDDAIEEERRLFYVGITRSKERLLLTHAKYRYTYGKMVDQFPSRFLHEVPQNIVQKDDCSYWNNIQQHTFFADWLGIKQQDTVITFNTAFSASKKPKKSPRKNTSTARSSWRKNQPVSHAKYGLGMIQKIEKKGDQTYVTVKFKQGLKKIVSRFLQLV